MTHKPTIGIFAGSFDPLTNGHLDLITRSCKLFDKVIVLIAINTAKKGLFTPRERLDLVKKSVCHLNNVEVDTLTDGLVANYYCKVGASALIRGVRNATDYEYEFSIAEMNRSQYHELETVILYASQSYRYLSSSFIKEIAYFGGDISNMVPEIVEQAMKEKYQAKKE